MPSSISPSILKALSLPPTTPTQTTPISGGSGFASTLKLILNPSLPSSRTLFLKSSTSPGAAAMFLGEHTSLNALSSAVPGICPRSLAHGSLEEDEKGGEGKGGFLVTEWLEFSRGGKAKAGSESLGTKLGRLHGMSAPIPEGYDKPVFGFPVGTCCGSSMQDNGFEESWSVFYGERRLNAIARDCERKNGRDQELREMVERTVKKVVPRLLGEGHLGGARGVEPVVVHGDLWSGNWGLGRVGEGEAEEVVFDPSACWAHAEFEHGIVKMFGGFGKEFWRDYWKLRSKDEPVEEYADRVELYELYHHLNHYALFGGGYRSGAMAIMKRLNSKY